MKTKILIGCIVLLAFSACSSRYTNENSSFKESIKPEKNEEDKWDLTVFDSQYEYFLTAIARPKSQYSSSFLHSKNVQLVSEWNSYYHSGKYRNIIESSIEYDSSEKYDFDFEYKLYQVFAYVYWKYGLNFIWLSQADKR